VAQSHAIVAEPVLGGCSMLHSSQSRLGRTSAPPVMAPGATGRRTGQQVDFVFDSSPVILKKLADGEAADVLIVQPDHLADLIKSGKLVPGEHPVIGRVGLGLAARADAFPQSVATVEVVRDESAADLRRRPRERVFIGA
jgi:hypothetical protein